VRLKTFIVTYLLFLSILFVSLGIVSAYLVKSQTDMLKEKSIGEYHSIAALLAKDIAVLHGKSGGFSAASDYEAVSTLVNGYKHYYRRYNIEIAVTDLSLSIPGDSGSININTEISFIISEQDHYIRITGALPEPFRYYQFDYYLDITPNITAMQNIQSTLLLFAIIFSVFTTIALYLILLGIFKPLNIIADTSRKIADGKYNERIHVKGKNELAEVAYSFNRMAEEIEKQIRILADEAVGKLKFADNLAHEIRTPLTTIYGYAEYLQKTSRSEEEIIESAQYIIDEANHMKNIANSLLELSTLRNYTPAKSKLSIPMLFEDVARSLDNSLRELNIRLICHPDATVLDGQEDLIKILLMNLCLNALKACTPGNGIICLNAAKQDKKTVLSVTDNGCGIPEECLAKVAEPFYRVDKSRSREQGGAGLGLTLSMQIAKVHDAEMIIESEVGAGTCIKVIFTSF
jgi:signal transduction histidine kinase